MCIRDRYQPRPVLQTGEDIGVKHIIADIVHGALACALPVLATMVMAVGLTVLPVLPVGQRPAAIRTFYQPGKNLCRTVLALPAAACYLLLHLIENLLADNRLLVLLRDVNDCSFEEIEQATGLNAINIRVLMSRFTWFTSSRCSISRAMLVSMGRFSSSGGRPSSSGWLRRRTS